MIAENTRFHNLITTGNHKVVREKSGNTYTYYEVVCDCGNVFWIRGTGLTNGGTKSCGCIHKSGIHSKHNETNSRLYRIWNNMRTRCNKEYCDSFKYYGARGITVCKEWDNTDDGFQNFSLWAMENGYSDDLTIDRINNNGNYEPANCRWVNMSCQNRNKRSCHFVKYNGRDVTIKELSEITNISEKTLSARINKGMSVEETITKPIRKNHKHYMYDGEYRSLKEISLLTGLNYNTLQTRARQGKLGNDYIRF